MIRDRLPFAVARSSRATLVEQVAEGLRRAIDSGFYKPGDVLPTTRDLATSLGVSRIVTRAAVRELAEAGLINPKPSVGSVVLGRSGKLWRGNVLFISPSNGRIYYANVFIATLRARLVKAGWLVTQVSATTDSCGKADTSELEFHLTHPVALAIVLFDNRDAERILSSSGVPFVTIKNTSCRRRGCVGFARYDRSVVASDLAAAAVSAGVKSALQIGWQDLDDVGPALKDAGIRTSKWVIPVLQRKGKEKMPASVSFVAYDAVLKWLMGGESGKRGKMDGRRKEGLPDLIYFSDDHVCAGALTAFADAGVRVPEDVRVATFSNLGNDFLLGRTPTRMEMDPEGDAEKVASAVLACLEGRSDGFPITLGPEFRKGATL